MHRQRWITHCAVFHENVTMVMLFFPPQDIQLTASNDDQYFVFEDILFQVRL